MNNEYKNVNNDEIIDDVDEVDIICPECHNHVVIGADNKCPECGCEFEEVPKKFRLTKLGIFCGILSSVIFMFVMILLKFITNPENISKDSLFYLDAFRNLDIFLFIVVMILSFIILSMFFVIGICNKKIIFLSSMLIALIFSIICLLILYSSEGDKSFYILVKLIFLLPIVQAFSSICCLIDLLIKPKSKL